ncbi:hypothetical protein ACIB24_00890 [Spongisporangium articulatum]|uniref:Uncharacterized protein n=1 Tax=Spongisporangium articulatum TaxID=3362603 RepID=A0ABW8AGY5_9ACTN
MTHEKTHATEPQLTPAAALDEVARRRGQATAAANQDWSARSLALLCLALLLMGVGLDVENPGVVTIGIALSALLAGHRVRVRERVRTGPGWTFTAVLLALSLAALVLSQIPWRLADLPFPYTAGMTAAGLVVLAAAPLARRRIERRAGTKVPW